MSGGARFRDEVLARVRSAPPDPGYHLPDRRAWRLWMALFARALDERRARRSGRGRPSRLAVEAFRAFLPLVDPGWWRAHPTVRLNARARTFLRHVRKLRKRSGRSRWLRGELEPRLCEAIEAFARGGDRAGVATCWRLIEAMSDSAPPPAVAELAGEISGRERRPARRGPAFQTRRCKPPRRRGRRRRRSRERR